VANMNVTAKFVADISDVQTKMHKMNGLYKDSAGRWRTSSGQFASASDRAAAGIDGMTRSVTRANKGFTILRGAVGTALGGAAIGAIYAGARAIQSFAKGSIDAAVEARKADDRIKAIATSMGVLDTTLGGSTGRILDFASELQNTTGVSDEVIKQGQALLLTFSNIASSAGEAGGMFDRATTAALDLSAAGFGSVEGASKQLGKALQDPIKGLTALGRSGVTFTNAEKEKIKALVESGKTLEAQTIIMKAVETQVGGTAAATMTAGDRMRVAFDEFQETVGAAVLPAVEKIQLFIANKVVPALEKFVEYVKANIVPVVAAAFDSVRSAISLITPVFVSIIQKVIELKPLLIALIVPITAGALAFKLFNAVPGILTKVGVAVNALKAKVIALNAAILLNPAVAIAAAVVAAFALMAIAFKMVYDRSKPLRDAVSNLVNTFKAIVSVIVNDIVGAFTSGSNAMQKAGDAGASIGEIFQKVADIAGKYLAKYIQFVTGYIKVLGSAIRVLIKIWEVLFKILQMIVGIVKATVIGTFKSLGAIFTFVTDRLGPVGAAFKKVASTIASSFGNIGGFVKSAMSGAVSFIENAINMAIGAINFLIRAYNGIPLLDDIAEVSEISFAKIAEEGKTAAFSAERASAAVAGRYSGMAETGKGFGKKTLKPVEEGGGGGGGAGDKESKALEAAKAKYDKLKESLDSARTAFDSIAAATESRFGEPSQILKAFGNESDIGGVISAYDQLDATIRDYYGSLAKAPGLSKKAVSGLNARGAAERAALKSSVEVTVGLMRERDKIKKALSDLDESFALSTKGIGETFDGLDKAASEALQAVTSKFDSLIPALESALSEATSAFERENDVLKSLVSERNSFLGGIAAGVKSFVNSFSFDGADSASIQSQLEARLQTVRDFTANIRTLIAKGLDPALVQEFIAAGVSGAGDAVSALALGSASEIAGINAIQTNLASEIVGFQEFASQQWYDAGIAQQEAIVGPLALAQAQAATALSIANASRTAELTAAQAHIDSLKVQRTVALEEARADYERQRLVLEDQGKKNEEALTANALAVETSMKNLQATLPPEMVRLGRMAVQGITNGFKERFPALQAKLGSLMDALAESLNRVSTVTVRTVYEGGGLAGARAMGGPVSAAKAYLVGEKGPEVFVPGMTGNIIPNNNLGSLMSQSSGSGGGGSTTIVNINVQTGIATDPAETGRQVVEAIRKYERRSGPVFVSA
jgi:phage-related protein/predicted ATPase